eukprot:s3732_g8.t1
MMDDDEANQLDAHFTELEAHLASQLSYGELDLSLAELREVRSRCHAVGLGAGALGALDDAIAGEAEELSFSIDITSDGDQVEIISCAGDYLALFRHYALAETQYRVSKDDFGLARCLAERLARERRDGKDQEELEELEVEALNAALRALRHVKESDGLGLCRSWERRASQVLHLLDDLSSSAAPGRLEGSLGDETPLEFIEMLGYFLRCSAAGAVESLSRRLLMPAPFLPQRLPSLHGVQLPPGIRTLLIDSRAFCQPGLESAVRRWRLELRKALNEASLRPPSNELLASAAAVACHCHFTGYCIPLHETDEEPQGSMPDGAFTDWLVSAMYEVPRHDASAQVEAMDGVPELAELICRTRKQPKEEEALIKTLEYLCEDDLVASPCRDFYDCTLYPPWHFAVESVGVIPARHLEVLGAPMRKTGRAVHAGASGRALKVHLSPVDT